MLPAVALLLPLSALRSSPCERGVVVPITRRAACLPILAAAPSVAAAFNLPGLGSAESARREEEKRAAEVEAKEARAAMLKRVRAERMAAEARAQSEEYSTRMKGLAFGAQVQGTMTVLPDNFESSASPAGSNP